MDWGPFKELTRALVALWDKLITLLRRSPTGAMQLTGVMGLAALLVGYYRFRGGDSGGSTRQRRGGGAGAGSSSSHSHSHSHGAHNSFGTAVAGSAETPASGINKATPQTTAPRSPSSGAAANAPRSSLQHVVHSRLTGIKKVTLSAPGVLFAERTASQLQDGATVRPEALAVLREVLCCARVYLINHVDDDVGETVVLASLEDANLTGTKPGQVPVHTVLFCSTLGAKVSMVRQLEPDLHIDAEWDTVHDLKRFVPQLLHIHGRHVAAKSYNIMAAESFEAFFRDPEI